MPVIEENAIRTKEDICFYCVKIASKHVIEHGKTVLVLMGCAYG